MTAVLTLAAGVAAGLYLDDDSERAAQQANAAYLEKYEAGQRIEQELMQAHRAEKVRAEAIRRARLAAEAEAARKQAAEEAARNRRTPDFGPIPESCQVYEGNRAIGCTLMLEAGYGLEEMPCLEKLWTKESGWNHRSYNESSGAYGIPQALPGSKMASAGDDWKHNPATQIKWGLGYIKNRYDTPCGAWQYFLDKGWY